MKTVRVRIAVAVGPDGEWNASGWSKDGKSKDQDAMECVIESVEPGELRYFVEAELTVPECKPVKADKVDPA